MLCAEPVPVYWTLLVGDSSVGKSSMLKRFMEDAFDADIKATEGASSMQKQLQLQHGPARLQVPTPRSCSPVYT